jgi:hypothetical protein
MSLDRNQKLVLRRRQPGLSGLLLAPAEEAPERYAEAQVLPEVFFGRVNGIASSLVPL